MLRTGGSTSRGLALRPGSVSEARREAGLSLAGVASGVVTRAAIHQIETGRSRPRAATLRLIAARTGKPLSYFLDESAAPIADRPPDQPEQDQLEQLERLELAGAHNEVADLAGQVAAESRDARVRALALHALGQAQVRLRRLRPALESLRAAREQFELYGDRWKAVESMDLEAVALYLLESPEAANVIEEVLSRCRALDPVPTDVEARILAHQGAIYLAARRWDESIRAYDAAVEAAGALRDLRRVATMYNDLSGAYQEMGRLADAAKYAHKALALQEINRDRAEMARTTNNLGLVLLRQHRLDEALEKLMASLALCEEARLESGRAHVLLSLGEVHLARGEFDAARERNLQALELAGRLGEEMPMATAHKQLGATAAAQGDPDEADRQFKAAIALFTDIGALEPGYEAHVAYARVLRGRHDRDAALEQWEAASSIVRPHLAQPDDRSVHVFGQPADARTA